MTGETEPGADTVYRCPHGTATATRYANGTWVGHHPCLICSRPRRPWVVNLGSPVGAS